MSIREIRKLEERFPKSSGKAFAAARKRVIAAGQSVLHSEDGVIYCVFPDGGKEIVKKIDPPTLVQRGKKIIIR